MVAVIVSGSGATVVPGSPNVTIHPFEAPKNPITPIQTPDKNKR